MKCDYVVPRRVYSKPGPCLAAGVEVVRWAPTPLRTKVYKLCRAHRKLLEAGRLEIVKKCKGSTI